MQTKPVSVVLLVEEAAVVFVRTGQANDVRLRRG